MVSNRNAKNFKAADKELKALLLQLNERKVEESILNKGVEWHFNPPTRFGFWWGTLSVGRLSLSFNKTQHPETS